jgi:hypothetical protein
VEIGVTRISPSNPKPRGENSIGTLLKFRVLETPVEGMTGKCEIVNGVSKEGDGKLLKIPGSTVETPPSKVFLFLIIFSGSTSGVARGS